MHQAGWGHASQRACDGGDCGGVHLAVVRVVHGRRRRMHRRVVRRRGWRRVGDRPGHVVLGRRRRGRMRHRVRPGHVVLGLRRRHRVRHRVRPGHVVVLGRRRHRRHRHRHRPWLVMLGLRRRHGVRHRVRPGHVVLGRRRWGRMTGRRRRVGLLARVDGVSARRECNQRNEREALHGGGRHGRRRVCVCVRAAWVVVAPGEVGWFASCRGRAGRAPSCSRANEDPIGAVPPYLDASKRFSVAAHPVLLAEEVRHWFGIFVPCKSCQAENASKRQRSYGAE